MRLNVHPSLFVIEVFLYLNGRLAGFSGENCEMSTGDPHVSVTETDIMTMTNNIIGDLSNLSVDQLQQLLAAILQALIISLEGTGRHGRDIEPVYSIPFQIMCIH